MFNRVEENLLGKRLEMQYYRVFSAAYEGECRLLEYVLETSYSYLKECDLHFVELFLDQFNRA